MIVADAGQLRAPFFLAPANILIALPALPGRRTKQQARQQPSPVLANGILQVLSYRAAGAKIVKLRQRGGQLLPLGLHTADFLYFNPAQFCESTAVGCLIPAKDSSGSVLRDANSRSDPPQWASRRCFFPNAWYTPTAPSRPTPIAEAAYDYDS